MTAYKCDRCGKFFSQEEYENMLRSMENRGIKYPYVVTGTGRGYDDRLDLCPDCATVLAEWVKPKEEE